MPSGYRGEDSFRNFREPSREHLITSAYDENNVKGGQTVLGEAAEHYWAYDFSILTGQQ